MNDRREYFTEGGKERHLSDSHKPVGVTWVRKNVGISARTFYRMIADGRIKTINPGNPDEKRTTPALVWAALRQ